MPEPTDRAALLAADCTRPSCLPPRGPVLPNKMSESVPDIPEPAKTNATTQLAEGVPFISDTDLETALAQAGVDQALADQIVAENRAARIAGLDAAITLLILAALVSLFFTGSIPSRQAGSEGTESDPQPDSG